MFGAGGSLLSDQTVYLFYTNVILLVVLAIASAGVPGKLRRWYGRFSERRPLPQALLRSDVYKRQVPKGEIRSNVLLVWTVSHSFIQLSLIHI